jgi:hypothetical protein
MTAVVGRCRPYCVPVILVGALAAALVACLAPSASIGNSDVFLSPKAGDDTDRLQRAFDALQPNQTLVLSAGVYEHSDILRIRVPRTRIVGRDAKLMATQESRSAVRIDADEVSVENIAFTIAGTAGRWDTPDQMKVQIGRTTGVVLRSVHIVGSAAAGIFVSGASNFRIEQATVSDTRADGILITGGSHDGEVVGSTIERSGDDGVAVVSYEGDGAICRNIMVIWPTVKLTNGGRGVSVVGGENIIYTNIHVDDTRAAAVYVAVEGAPYNTWSSRNVQVSGGTIARANSDSTIDHGAVLIYAGRPGQEVSDIKISALQIVDTRASASSDVAIRAEHAGTLLGISMTDLSVQGGPSKVFQSDIDRSAYHLDGWQVDGRPYVPD